MNWLVLDLSSAPLADAAEYLTPAAERKPPKNYTKPDSIAAWQAEDYASDLSRAALDLDLARISGLAFIDSDQLSVVQVAGDSANIAQDGSEEGMVRSLGFHCSRVDKIITFGGFHFDLPLLMRRAKYLGVPFPWINTDRYKSPHVDLCDLLSDRDPSRRRSLQFYARRLKMGLTKPLSGAEEAQVPVTGKWTELAKSLEHDVCAIKRLAEWAGVIK